ncbi:DUF2007 domain-containing protein [Corallincola holothuriorum]|uniref:DUF2007 domain-containing protein n=1 Tax=Corallincola holothuriorum TaxID=2282215 RepID=A0A368NJB3_9GAMM|nr:DUF2007 domain-containing protein [Corallincola holothuriorum]RCU49519.1 DUF2007 domain-containing protein [Corallincola holothuriorum]
MTGSVVVAIFDFPYEAQIARDNLELSGIPAVVANEHVASMQLGNSAGGIRLLVLAEHLERARLVLASDHSKDVSDELGEKEEQVVVSATTDVEVNYVALAESSSSASTLVKKQSLESMRCLAVRPERIVWQPLSGTRTSERSHRMQLTVGDNIGFRTTISAYLVSFLPLLIGVVLVIALSHKPIRSLSIETSQWISYAFFILLLFISWQTLMDKITTPDFDLKGARFIQNHRVWWWPWRVRKESFAYRRYSCFAVY